MSNPMKSKTIAVPLDGETKVWLKQQCKARHISAAEFIRSLIRSEMESRTQPRAEISVWSRMAGDYKPEYWLTIDLNLEHSQAVKRLDNQLKQIANQISKE